MPSPVTTELKSVSNGKHDVEIAIVRFDDGNRNVINHEVLDALEAAFDWANASGASAIVLMGRQGSFCAGYDITVMTGGDADAANRLGVLGGRLAKRLYTSPVPVIGLCEGHSFTIGTVWLACCDVSVAEDGPFKVAMTEVALNVTLNGWALEAMRAKLSRPHHVPALLHSTIYSPTGAQEAGFFDHLVAAGDGMEQALQHAARLGSLPSKAYVETKLAMRAATIEVMTAHLG